MTVPVSLDVSAVPADPRGAGRYVFELAAALARRDDVGLTLVCGRGDEPRWRAAAPGAATAGAAPHVRPLRLLWEQLAMPRLLDRAGVDVHHGPHYTMPERWPHPRVVTVHDLTFFDHPEWHERSKVLVFRRAIRVAARRAAAIVCVSESGAERLRAWCRPRGAVHVVSHGVDHDRFNALAAEDDEPRRRQLGVRQPYVAFVGTIEPRKDVPTLVAAFDRLVPDHADLTLVIAGGAGWGGGAVDAAIAASPYRDRIVRTGYVVDDSIPALLRGAAAVAYPSLEEGFGLPALEALACGAPLVTTSGTAMAELTGDAAVLVPAGDADALAEGLDEALRDGDAGRARSERGLAIAAARTWDACAAGHVAVYRSVT